MNRLTLFAAAATFAVALAPAASQAQHPGGGGSKKALTEGQHGAAQSPASIEEEVIRYRLGGSSTMTVGVARDHQIDVRRRLIELAEGRSVPQARLAGVRIEPGAIVPREKVRIRRLPADVVRIAPEYINFEYFLLEGGVVVIVNPRSYEIMDVIAA